MPVPQSVSTASWTAAARPREVPGLRRAVTRFAADHGVVEPPIDGLRLAVSEAVTNAIVHGFGDGDPGQVRVSLAIDRSTQSVELVVTDDGHGMSPRPDSPGLGLGLPLIASLAEKMEIRSPERGSGVAIWVRFALPPA